MRLLLLSLTFLGAFTFAEKLHAQAEITHPSNSATRSTNIVAPDGRHTVAMLISNGSFQTPYNLVIARQPTDASPAGWTDTVNFPLDSLSPYHYRLKSGKSTAWVAWQGQPTAGNTRKIQIRQIHPIIGPIETVDGSQDQSAGFDLAIDDFERPCIVSFKTSTEDNPSILPFIRLHRRGTTGIWEQTLVASYPQDEIPRPEEVAIATRGNFIHVFDVAWAQVTFTGVPLRSSQLYHTEIEAPGALSSALFEFYDVASETSTSAQGFLPAIASVSAVVDSTGRPAVSYCHLGARQLKYRYPTGTSTWAVETIIQPGGGITAQYLNEAQLLLDPADRPNIVWRSNNIGSVARAIRDNSTWSTDSVFELALYQPSFAFDRLGNPHYTGADFNTTGLITAARSVDITDSDSDGFTHLEEAAFVMTGLANPNERKPVISIVTVGGTRYPAITYFRPIHAGADSNPFVHPDFRYTVEISGNLSQWTTAGLVHVETATIPSRYTAATWRSATPLTGNTSQFLKMRVERIDNN